jgi:LacI family transcriptional regulator
MASTIYEVAKRAGVSPATVSRFYNGVNVSEEKKKAIRAAARELRFTPNRTARTLRKQTSEVIALIIPNIENPYFAEVARGVENVAWQAGYSLVLCNSDNQTDKESTYLQIAISGQMAGVILAAATDDETDLSDLLAAQRPVVAIDRTTTHDVDAVIMANREAGESATETLVQAGFTRIACISGPKTILTARERAAGWRSVMLRHLRAKNLDGLLSHSAYDVDGGRSAMEQFLRLSKPPDAVVVAHNLQGVGTIQVLTEQGLTPPAFGVSVIGSLPFSTLPAGSVTIVRLPARHMGATAAKILLERIAGDNQPTRTVVLRNELQTALIPERS